MRLRSARLCAARTSTRIEFERWRGCRVARSWRQPVRTRRRESLIKMDKNSTDSCMTRASAGLPGLRPHAPSDVGWQREATTRLHGSSITMVRNFTVSSMGTGCEWWHGHQTVSSWPVPATTQRLGSSIPPVTRPRFSSTADVFEVSPGLPMGAYWQRPARMGQRGCSMQPRASSSIVSSMPSNGSGQWPGPRTASSWRLPARTGPPGCSTSTDISDIDCNMTDGFERSPGRPRGTSWRRRVTMTRSASSTGGRGVNGHSIGTVDPFVLWPGPRTAGSWRPPARMEPRVLDPESGRERHRQDHVGPVLSVAWSCDGQLLASASGDGTVRVFQRRADEERHRHEHGGWVRALAWSPDGTLVATASDDGTTRVFDPFARTELHRHEHDGAVRAVSWSPDGIFVATASEDGTTRVFDPFAGREVHRHEHYDIVRAVAWSPDSTLVASTSEGTLRVSIHARARRCADTSSAGGSGPWRGAPRANSWRSPVTTEQRACSTQMLAWNFTVMITAGRSAPWRGLPTVPWSRRPVTTERRGCSIRPVVGSFIDMSTEGPCGR